MTVPILTVGQATETMDLLNRCVLNKKKSTRWGITLLQNWNLTKTFMNSSGTAQRFLSILREVYLRTMLLRHNHLFPHQPQLLPSLLLFLLPSLLLFLLPSLLLFLLPSLLLFLNRHHLRPQVTVIGVSLLTLNYNLSSNSDSLIILILISSK